MKSISPMRLWQDCIVYILCIIPIIVMRCFVEPYHRGFFCDDESIRYPILSDTVSFAAVAVTGVIVPLVIILCVEGYRLFVIDHKDVNGYVALDDYVSSAQDTYIHNRLMHPLFVRFSTYAGAFLFGGALCEVISDIGKITIGELRPHFLEACQPDWSAINCTAHRYITNFMCQTSDISALKEARQSFPSGHAAFAAYASCFAVIYLRKRAAWQLSSTTGRLIRPFAQFGIIIAAFVVGLTRISDYKHHAVDVMAGFALGVALALAVCYQFEFIGTSKNVEEANYRSGTDLTINEVNGVKEFVGKETDSLLAHVI